MPNKNWGLMSKIIATKLAVLMFIMSTASCAPQAKNVQASYVSPLQYQQYNCDQIGQEISRVSRKVSEVSGAQDSAASKDAVAMGVGMVIFWPALFFLIGGNRKDELAHLKGEYEAMERIAIEKNCTSVLAGTEESRKKQREIEREQKEQEQQESTSQLSTK